MYIYITKCKKKDTLNGDETDTNAGSQICTKRAKVNNNSKKTHEPNKVLSAQNAHRQI